MQIRHKTMKKNQIKFIKKIGAPTIKLHAKKLYNLNFSTLHVRMAI